MNTSLRYDLQAAQRAYRHRAAPEANEKYQLLVRKTTRYFLSVNNASFTSRRRTIAEPKEPSAEERWSLYLESLEKRGLLVDTIIESAQRILTAIAQAMPGTVPPNARLTDDGQLRMYWNRNGRYLEIIIAATTFEWSYTDTDAGIYDDYPDIPSTEPPPSKLLDRIALV
jgi:hypothetical protein